MTNQEIINFLYYLWDNLDPADKNLKEIIDKLKTEEVSNEQNRK